MSSAILGMIAFIGAGWPAVPLAALVVVWLAMLVAIVVAIAGGWPRPVEAPPDELYPWRDDDPTPLDACPREGGGS